MHSKITRAAAAAVVSAAASFSPAMAAEVSLQDDGTVSYQEVRRIFDLLDAFDVEGFTGHLTDDAEVTFGNGPALVGIAAIQGGQNGFFSAIKAMKHDLDAEKIWSKKGSFVVEGLVTYTRHDDSTLTIPFADVFTLQGGKITTLNVHFDVAPLFAAAE